MSCFESRLFNWEKGPSQLQLWFIGVKLTGGYACGTSFMHVPARLFFEKLKICCNTWSRIYIMCFICKMCSFWTCFRFNVQRDKANVGMTFGAREATEAKNKHYHARYLIRNCTTITECKTQCFSAFRLFLNLTPATRIDIRWVGECVNALWMNQRLVGSKTMAFNRDTTDTLSCMREGKPKWRTKKRRTSHFVLISHGNVLINFLDPRFP